MSLPRVDRDRLPLPPAPPGLEAAWARPEDAAALSALSRALFGDEGLPASDWRRRLGPGHGLALLLRVEGAPRSYSLVELNRRQRRVYVVETGTLPEARGQGLARWLRRALHGVLAAQGYQSVVTHVRASNTAALRLNLGLGLAVRRRVPAYYDDGEEGLELALALDPPLRCQVS